MSFLNKPKIYESFISKEKEFSKLVFIFVIVRGSNLQFKKFEGFGTILDVFNKKTRQNCFNQAWLTLSSLGVLCDLRGLKTTSN